MSFPKALDDARVLYFTAKSSYGTVCYTSGETAHQICYLAICKYENDNNYCLFGCDENYNVLSDSSWCSVEECMKVACCSYDRVISWISVI